MSYGIVNLIEEVIDPVIKDLGFDLVKINMRNNDSAVFLEILIERLDGNSISIGDCRLVSHNISALLDVEDIIKGKYYLEVSSPGVERPLVKLKDYRRFVGGSIRMRLKTLLHGTSHYKGVISRVEEEPAGGVVHLRADNNTEVAIPFEIIKSAYLMMTDEMFRKILNKR